MLGEWNDSSLKNEAISWMHRWRARASHGSRSENPGSKGIVMVERLGGARARGCITIPRGSRVLAPVRNPVFPSNFEGMLATIEIDAMLMATR